MLHFRMAQAEIHFEASCSTTTASHDKIGQIQNALFGFSLTQFFF